MSDKNKHSINRYIREEIIKKINIETKIILRKSCSIIGAKNLFINHNKIKENIDDNDLNILMEIASRNNIIKLLTYTIEKFSTNYEKSIKECCIGNNLLGIKILKKLGAVDRCNGFMEACKLGHEKIVIYMINNFKTDINYGLKMASMKGNYKIIKILFENGANNYDLALLGACKGGYLKIVQEILEKYFIQDISYPFYYACSNGRTEIINYLLYNKTNYIINCTLGIIGAIIGNKEKVIEILLNYIEKKNKNEEINFERIITEICHAENKNLTNRIIEFCQNNKINALCNYCKQYVNAHKK